MFGRLLVLGLAACSDGSGSGRAGQAGADGAPGTDGTDGVAGADGVNGIDGAGPCLSVAEFGATGDGVTDDTEAIQATIDALPTWTDYGVGSAGRVCLQAGTYRVTRPLEVPDFVSLQGAGMWSTQIVADPSFEPMSVFTREGENAQKNVMFFDIGVILTDPESVAFDLRYMTRAVVERCLVYNPSFIYGEASFPPAGVGIRMAADASHSGYDNRVLNNEMYGVSTGVLVGNGAHAAVIENNTINGGDWAVSIDAEGGDRPVGVRITHNRFEAMQAGFLSLGGQDAVVEDNYLEAYTSDGLTAGILMPAGSRWNTVGDNYLTLASTPAVEVVDEGENNSWRTWYTRILESRVSGDNLEQRIVRVGDDLPRGLTIQGSYVALGDTVRVATRSESVTTGEALDPSLSTHVHVSGGADNVTIGTTGTAMGALLMLTGNGTSVEIVNGGTADIAGGAITLGGSSGEYTGITLIYGGSGMWLEVSRSAVRP